MPVEPLAVEALDSAGTEVSVNADTIPSIIIGNLKPYGFYIRDDFGPGTYYFKVTTSAGVASHPVPYTIHAYEDIEYTEFIEDCEARTRSLNNPQISDPLYSCQWHLNSAEGGDANVEAAWAQGVTGEGVNVAVVDDGMYYTHEDLRDNVDTSLNHDYTGRGSIYTPLEHHGTHVSGIIAARDNDIGVRGVAPRATVYGYNFLAETTVLNQADAMARNRDVTAVSNNSWWRRDGPGLAHGSSFWEQAVKAGLASGYDGNGVLYVFIAGNGHLEGGDSNLSEVANYYGVTTVCAVNDHDTRSIYSEMGTNLWVCAPSDDRGEDYKGIVTTENSDRYYEEFDGTSAAAPIVAGVAALLRDANPDLTWRDLKLILAGSARKNDPDNAGWQEGGAQVRVRLRLGPLSLQSRVRLRDGRRRGRGRPGKEMDNRAAASGVERVVRGYWRDGPSARRQRPDHSHHESHAEKRHTVHGVRRDRDRLRSHVVPRHGGRAGVPVRRSLQADCPIRHARSHRR